MTKMRSQIFGVIIMALTQNKDDKQIKFDLEQWEPEPIVVEFEPDPELGLDLEDGEVIEFELEPLKN